MNDLSSKKNYFYKIYNLNIKSNFYLPEFYYNEFETLTSIDVNILLGTCPSTLHNIKVSNEYYTLNENEGIFETKECGKFYIKNGNTIIIEPIENPNYEHLKAFLYGRAFAILLFQRNTLALHGNSIVIDNNTFVFCGTSGSGKSTISTSLLLNGHKMISDDLSVVTFDKDNKPMICPGLINIKLCVDTIKYFNLDKENLIKVDDYANKYALQPKYKAIKIPQKVTTLIELNVDYKNKDSAVTIQEIHGAEKLQIIFKNIFRAKLLTDISLKPQYLKNCLNTAKNIRIFKLTRPKGKFTLNEQLNIINKIQGY